MLTFQNIEQAKAELDALMQHPMYKHMEQVTAKHDELKNIAAQFVSLVDGAYDCNQDVWNVWCDQNLTEDEKAYILSTYNGIKLMMATSR
jgi:hypothetical protein